MRIDGPAVAGEALADQFAARPWIRRYLAALRIVGGQGGERWSIAGFGPALFANDIPRSMRRSGHLIIWRDDEYQLVAETGRRFKLGRETAIAVQALLEAGTFEQRTTRPADAGATPVAHWKTADDTLRSRESAACAVVSMRSVLSCRRLTDGSVSVRSRRIRRRRAAPESVDYVRDPRQQADRTAHIALDLPVGVHKDENGVDEQDDTQQECPISDAQHGYPPDSLQTDRPLFLEDWGPLRPEDWVPTIPIRDREIQFLGAVHQFPRQKSPLKPAEVPTTAIKIKALRQTQGD